MQYLKKSPFLHKVTVNKIVMGFTIYTIETIQIRFVLGLHFTYLHWLSPTRPKKRATSQKIHIIAQYAPQQNSIRMGHLPSRNNKNSNSVLSGFHLQKMAMS